MPITDFLDNVPPNPEGYKPYRRGPPSGAYQPTACLPTFRKWPTRSACRAILTNAEQDLRMGYANVGVVVMPLPDATEAISDRVLPSEDAELWILEEPSVR